METRVETVVITPRVRASAPLNSAAYRYVKGSMMPQTTEPRHPTAIHAFSPSLPFNTSLKSWRKVPSLDRGCGGTSMSFK